MKCGALHPSSWITARLILSGFGFVFGCAIGVSAAESRSDSPAQVRKTVLAHYMTWFVSEPIRGEWGTHWTGNRGQFNPAKLGDDGVPELAAHYYPLLGPYDSSDPHLIECHLLQMKLAGIDGVIVDWYGLAQQDDYPQSHQAALALFTASAKLGLKFAVCFEDRTSGALSAARRLLERISDDSSTEAETSSGNGFLRDVRPIVSRSLSTNLSINMMLASNTIGEGKRY